MIEKLKTALWFAARPSFWAHAAALAARKLQPDRDGEAERAQASAWAAAQAVPVPEALRRIGLLADGASAPRLDPALIAEATANAARSAVAMGGPGDLDLLHAAVAASGATRVVETGVAYGWSSLAILAALEGRAGARLASVDMPYPKMGNEAFVGVAVPDRLRAGWTLIREPDRNGLPRAIAALGGTIDLAHYDSDKSWYGRRFGLPLMWAALRPGGVLICDDIQDNLGFRAFVEEIGVACAVTESGGKFVGIAVKP